MERLVDYARALVRDTVAHDPTKNDFYLRVMHAFSASFVLTMVVARTLHVLYPTRIPTQTGAEPDGGTNKVPLPTAAREDLKRPGVAWPTLALLAAAYALAGLSFHGYMTARWRAPVSMSLSCLSKYLAFTALHDAVHGAVIPAWPRANDALGYAAGFLLMAPFQHFRQLHLCHHRYTSDHADAHADTRDPDEWAGRSFLPLRWVTIPWRYVYFYFRHTADIRLALVEYGALALVNAGFTRAVWRLCAHDKLDAMLLCHTLPTFLTFAFLAFFFDWLPHRPHVVAARADPFRASHVTALLGAVDWPLWTLAALSQNMHAVHHAWPSVPWFMYGALWRKHGAEFTAKGTRTVPLFPPPGFFDEVASPHGKHD